MRKSATKRKNHIKYYCAPARGRASYFFTSFFLTLAVLSAVISFAVADGNSRRLGFNEASEVFAVSNSDNNVDITLLGNSFTIYKNEINSFDFVLIKVKQTYTSFEPEPVQLIKIACAEIEPEAEKLISFCQKYLPQNLRANGF